MRRAYKKHKISPDRVYNDVAVSQLINKVMRQGKKTIAQKIVYSAFTLIKEQVKKEPLEIFRQAIENASPLLEVKPKRIGGATYQVPMEVRGERRLALAFRWIIGGRAEKRANLCRRNWRRKLLMQPTGREMLLKRKTICTAWPKPTKPSPISPDNLCLDSIP